MNTLHIIFDWLLAASLRASVLTLVVFLLQAALRRHLTARMRYALWLPVLIVLLMPVFPQSRWSVETLFAEPPPTQQVQITPTPIDFSPSTIPVDPSPPLLQMEPIDWQRLIIMTWLTGASGILLFGSVSFLITLHRFKRSRHPVSDELTTTLAQIAREVRLRRVPCVWIASAIHSPAVTGFLRPTLLLPAQFDRSFTPAEARLVLKHELIHLKRHDLPLNALLCVLMALHWFNPLLWLAFFKARLDREAACDAQVLQHDSADRRREYGHALLKVETAFCPRGLSLGFVGIFQRGAALRSRIHSIATHKRPHALMRVIFIMCVAGMTFLGITQAQQTPSPKEDAPLIAIEIKIIKFEKATDWDFGGRLPSAVDSPFNASLLSPAELNEQLREAMRKDGFNITSYPRMVTLSDKEVLIKSVVNQPYKDKDGQVAHLPIGLVLKLKPALRDQMINLGIDLTDSALIDPTTGAAIAEFKGDHPTARSRIYKTLHETRDGQSSVIAGWDDGKPQSKRPLLYVITPHVIKPEEGGLPAGISFVGDTAKTNNFTVGNSAFRPGDSIQITSVERNADQLDVTAEYDLASADTARIALFITSKDKGRTKVEAGQSKTIAKGKGSVVLHHPHLYAGLPHLSFYGTADGKAFGTVYFGTPEEAAASKKLDLGHIKANKPVDATASAINAKLRNIILPRVQFRGATIEEAVEYLRVKSREFDTLDKTGVQFILRPGVTKPGLISLDLKEVPLLEALRYCTELAGLTYKVEPYAVTIAKGAPQTIVPSRASSIILPSVELRDATLIEAIELIRAKSRENDPDKKGVSILLKGDGGTAKMSLSLKDVPVSEALHYCAELANYQLNADKDGYVLTPAPLKGEAAPAPLKPSETKPPETDAQAKATELRRAKPELYDFNKAQLGDVLRFLATDAGINFFALPDDNPINQKLVTFSIRASPFATLESLCRANGALLVFDQDRWFIRAADDPTQIGKVHVLPPTQASVETIADDPGQIGKGYVLPQTQASVETILKDISSILGGDETKPVADKPQPSVQFKKEQNSVYVKATGLQHTWVSAYLRGLSSSAQSANAK